MKIKQIYSRNTDQEGWEGGQLAKQKREPECGCHAIYIRAKVITQNHTCLVRCTKTLHHPRTSAEYQLNKINM